MGTHARGGAAWTNNKIARDDRPAQAPPQALRRTTFTTSRLLEFASRRELVAQTGHDAHMWPLVVIKKLLDNALDAEEAGTGPEVEVEVRTGDPGPIAVSDNSPCIPPETGKALDDKYFTQTLLPDFMVEHPELVADWDVVFDARGTLHEPHPGRAIPLGTLAVRDYLAEIERHRKSPISLDGALGDLSLPPIFPTTGPDHAFGAVLFVEKGGFTPLFRAFRLAERFDVAIMSTKGMSVTASRAMVDELCARGVPLLVLHDFGRAGFSILGTLRGDTRRNEFRNQVEVIDLGLRLEDVGIWGLEPEASFDLRSGAAEATLRRDSASEAAVDFLREWRVELNAFPSDQLVTWLEGTLEAAGVRKVVPPDDMLATAWRRAFAAERFKAAAGALARRIEPDAARQPVPSDLRARVERALRDEAGVRWTRAVARAAVEGRP